MKLVDGKQIANEIYKEVADQVAALRRKPTLTVLTCAPNFETQKYLALKKRKAEEVGIALNLVELGEDATTEMFATCLNTLSGLSDGVVVQLPIPTRVNREAILEMIPASKDPDGFNYGKIADTCLPPVVGAIDKIASRYEVTWKGKRVAVVGHGRLVGQPAAIYAAEQGAIVEVLTEETKNFTDLLKSADIIISGVGQPNLITKEMVQPGAIIFDAGTSEEGGVLKGDVAKEVAEVASVMTPMPGGIGPITVACLLRNLVTLVRQG